MKKHLGILTLASALALGMVTAALAQTDGGGNGTAGTVTDSTAGYGMKATGQKNKMAPASGMAQHKSDSTAGAKGQAPDQNSR